MHYVFEAGAPRRVMHIERMTITGEHTLAAICGQWHAYNRTINAPFGLGRRVCRRCLMVLDRFERLSYESGEG